MKLHYRGVSYEYDPSKVESRKRGQPFKQVRGSGHAYNLIYRGVTYRNLTNKVVLFGALTVLALLIAATWMQAPKIHQAMKEAGKTSIEQLILRYRSSITLMRE